jgi:predicted RNA-binding protein with PIN domain
MALLIDGYNLLHASGILGRGFGPGGLERSRLALLNFVAESVPAQTLSGTTVVFDAAGAPPGLPHTLYHRGIAVRFARDYDSADALIEELILADAAPRRLTVVSSDHRLHRAARRRKAKAIDSDRWYAETPLDENHVEYWLARFADECLDQQTGDAEIFPPGYGEDMVDE